MRFLFILSCAWFCVTANDGPALQPSQVDEAIAALIPKDTEKKFDRIGWAKDIRSARALAEKNQRPVFLFTHDGRINTGRC